MKQSSIKMSENRDGLPSDQVRSPPGSGDSATDRSSLPGRSFGLREAIILSLVSCSVAVYVAWLHG